MRLSGNFWKGNKKDGLDHLKVEMNFNKTHYIIYSSWVPWILLLWWLPIAGMSQSSSPKEIVLKAVGGLQYDVVRFQVSPGEKIRLVLKNTDDMDHNLLITQPGKREEVVQAALQMGRQGPIKNFVPTSESVMYSIEVLSPGEEAILTFPAPMTEGVYPYVCTYPGHGAVMYGAMYVTTGDMPPLSRDPNVPEHRRSENGEMAMSDHGAHIKEWHPYELTPPYFYRIFMPESGPASIAVRLSDGLSYCWDAGRCQFRYAWAGDFLDISEPWSIKGDATAILLGSVFYREKLSFPLQIGVSNPKVEYGGYRLTEEGFPEFYYTVNGIKVYELIMPDEELHGMVRQFTIPEIEDGLQFTYTPQSGVKVTSDKGTWSGSTLQLGAAEARQFEIYIKVLGNGGHDM